MTHRLPDDAALDVERRPSRLHLGRGWVADWAPDGTGDYWPWCVNLSATEARTDGCACPRCAPHEQAGPGAADVAQRVAERTHTWVGNPADPDTTNEQEGTP